MFTKNLSFAIGALCAAVLLALSAPRAMADSYGALDFKALTLPAKVLAEVSEIPDKPYFLQGFSRKASADPWELFLETRRYSQTSRHFFGGIGSGIVDRSRGDYAAPSGETTIREEIVIDGKTVSVMYPSFHYENGLYSFWALESGRKDLDEYAVESGPGYLSFARKYRKYEQKWVREEISDATWLEIRRVFGWAQFEAVRSFAKLMIYEGIEHDVKTYVDYIQLTKRVTENRAEILGDPKYSERLNQTLPGTTLTVKDIMPVPLTEAKHFAPDFIVIGAAGWGGGMTNAIKVPGTEVGVVLDLNGLAHQYISGFALSGHEFTHANPYLQGTPLALYFDVEMWTALTNDLNEPSVENYLYHPYLSVVRRIVQAHFGYDSAEVIRRLDPASPVGLGDVREDEYRANSARVQTIREELLKLIQDPEKGFMVDFYTHPFFWTTVNTKVFCDSAAAFRLFVATRYDYAGIFDQNKVDKNGVVVPAEVQTKEWLTQEQESGRLKRLVDAAKTETGKMTKKGEEISKVEAQDFKCPADSRFFFMKPAEEAKIYAHLKDLIARAKSGESYAQFVLKRAFGDSLPAVAPSRSIK